MTSTMTALLSDVISNDRDSDECVLALSALADLAEEAGDMRQAVACRKLADDPDLPMGYLFSDRPTGAPMWVVQGVTRDRFAFREAFPDAKSAVGIDLPGYGRRFFALAVADCFDPPVAVVRTDHEQDAEDAFVEELDWAHLSPADLAHIDDPERLAYGPSGQPYESASVMVWEVYLVGITD